MRVTDLKHVEIAGHDVTQHVSGIEITPTSSPITALRRPDGSLEAIRIDYVAMTPAERDGIVEWVKGHRIDPGLVPVSVTVGYDQVMDEWLFPVRLRGHGGGIRYDLASGEIPERIVRRRRNPAAARRLAQNWGVW